MVLFHLGATAATAARRWPLLRRLEQITLDTNDQGDRWPAPISLDPGSILGGYSDPAGHVRKLLRQVCTEHLLLSDLDYDAAADRCEYLLQTSAYDYRTHFEPPAGRAPAYAPTRYAGLTTLKPASTYVSQTPQIAAAVRDLVADSTADATTKGPLGAGMFGGSLERFTTAANQFDRDYASQSPRRRTRQR